VFVRFDDRCEHLGQILGLLRDRRLRRRINERSDALSRQHLDHLVGQLTS
jgi:hypothetical protein